MTRKVADTRKQVDSATVKAPRPVEAGPQPLVARPRFTRKAGEAPAEAAQPQPKAAPKPRSKVIALKMTADPAEPAVTNDFVAGQIEKMAGIGLSRKDIRDILQLSESEMHAYSAVLELGQSKARFKVANAIFDGATDKKHPKFAQLAIFWAKARMGWRDDPAAADGPLTAPPEDEGPSETQLSDSFEFLMDRYRPPEKRGASGG
jgi:hypothetical protein